MPNKFKDIPIGTRFNRLTVTGRGVPYQRPNGKFASTSNCKCDCGESVPNIRNDQLKCGDVQSCGCWHKDPAMHQKRNLKITTHGHSKGRKTSPTYRSWQSMLSRCGNPSHKDSHIYLNVTVCDRWNPKRGGNFENFLADMGERPEGTTLDRKDGNQGYFAGNCRWATSVIQARNTTRAYPQEFVSASLLQWQEAKGKMTRAEFAKQIGVAQGTFENWLYRRSAS